MRILMLGNSLTTAHGLPSSLASLLGLDDADVVVHARGGARLAEHLNPRTVLGARTQRALEQGGWDHVVLQEMSNAPVRFRERYLDAAAALCEMARSSGAQPIIYATWAYAPTCPKLEKLGLSHDEMHGQMHAAFAQAAARGEALLADAGTAFHEHGERACLYAADGVHPSPQGAALAAACLADAISLAGSAALPKPYTVYLLRCEDGSFYTGITTDIERRFREHREGGPKAARYTRTHPVLEIAATWEAPDRAQASRLEYRIKQLTHAQKEKLANNAAHPEGTVLFGRL